MIKRITGYTLVILVTLYLFFMYDNSIVSGVLVMEMIYPLFSIIYIRILSRRVSVTFEDIPYRGERKKPVFLKLQIKNQLPFLQMRYRLLLKWKYDDSTNNKRVHLSGSVDPKNERKLTYELQPDYCGIVHITVEHIEIYDFLGVFCRKMKINQQRDVGIMPAFSLLELEVTRRTREFPADAAEYSPERGGNDPSEIYQIREYRSGDPVHNIHWKLTAKEDALRVKEHALPLGCAVLVWVKNPPSSKKPECVSRMIERTASLSLTLISKKCIHMAAWFEEKNERVVKCRVDSEEAVFEFISRILSLKPCEDEHVAHVYFEDAFKGERFSSIVTINKNAEILVDGNTSDFLQI